MAYPPNSGGSITYEKLMTMPYVKHTPRDELESVRKTLEAATQRQSDIIRLGVDVTPIELAALIEMCRESGGAFINHQTGTTHLLDLMAGPEVLYPLGTFMQLTRERSNRAVIPVKYLDDTKGQTPEQNKAFADSTVSCLRDVMKS